MTTAVMIIGILFGFALVIGLVAVGVRFYLKKKELEKQQIRPEAEIDEEDASSFVSTVPLFSAT